MTLAKIKFNFLPYLDSDDIAASMKSKLDISRSTASDLGQSALAAAKQGYYFNPAGVKVDWHHSVQATCANKISIAPTDALPVFQPIARDETRIQVANETTLMAAHRLVESGLRPLALNFADGITPGGGFLSGSRAQEEVLCRSSALYSTLVDDSMYQAHRQRQQPDSTDWSIYSPDVPVFRLDNGTALPQPWLLNILTCAAPYAPSIGRQESAELLRQRIHRVLAIARAYGYSTLVLGAWGCGAFGNDPQQTAIDFSQALENDFNGAFSDIVFAITDWSPERKFLSPFNLVFSDL
jgi:uncharacterized protein (TIGR02452 family)